MSNCIYDFIINVIVNRVVNLDQHKEQKVLNQST